jgi:hypothetical protein
MPRQERGVVEVAPVHACSAKYAEDVGRVRKHTPPARDPRPRRTERPDGPVSLAIAMRTASSGGSPVWLQLAATQAPRCTMGRNSEERS